MNNINNLKALISEIFIQKRIKQCIIYAVIPAILFYIISLFSLRSAGFTVKEILRDPAQQLDSSSFLGFLSNIGVWLWVSAAAICFFTVLAKKSIASKQLKELLMLVGFFSLLLAVDDFFLIHDRYIHQKIMFLGYALLASALLLRHYKTIINIDGFSFLLAGFLLALSILTDLTQYQIPLEYHQVQIFEEGFKFLGAASWLYFCSQAASHP